MRIIGSAGQMVSGADIVRDFVRASVRPICLLVHVGIHPIYNCQTSICRQNDKLLQFSISLYETRGIDRDHQSEKHIGNFQIWVI